LATTDVQNIYHCIKINVTETGSEDDDGIKLAQKRVQWWTLENIAKGKVGLVLN
jgi:hypothetical protein